MLQIINSLRHREDARGHCACDRDAYVHDAALHLKSTAIAADKKMPLLPKIGRR